MRDHDYERFEDIVKRFADEDGDHFSLLNIYNAWKKNRSSDSFAKTNFFNIRALK